MNEKLHYLPAALAAAAAVAALWLTLAQVSTIHPTTTVPTTTWKETTAVATTRQLTTPSRRLNRSAQQWKETLGSIDISGAAMGGEMLPGLAAPQFQAGLKVCLLTTFPSEGESGAPSYLYQILEKSGSDENYTFKASGEGFSATVSSSFATRYVMEGRGHGDILDRCVFNLTTSGPETTANLLMDMWYHGETLINGTNYRSYRATVIMDNTLETPTNATAEIYLNQTLLKGYTRMVFTEPVQRDTGLVPIPLDPSMAPPDQQDWRMVQQSDGEATIDIYCNGTRVLTITALEDLPLPIETILYHSGKETPVAQASLINITEDGRVLYSNPQAAQQLAELSSQALDTTQSWTTTTTSTLPLENLRITLEHPVYRSAT